ncbi:hypothetical protein H5999_12065, partial [[Clostridium] spiroforme]|nr:hypothetical protein [Thomasclavelia spiroformis]
GVTYSKEEYKVEVSVSDAGNGQLQIDKKVTKDGEDVAGIVFTNTYSAVFSEDTTMTISGTKQLTVPAESSTTLTEGQFSFEITGAKSTNAENSKGGEPEITAENKIYKGSIDILKDQTYTQAGEYVYEI